MGQTLIDKKRDRNRVLKRNSERQLGLDNRSKRRQQDEYETGKRLITIETCNNFVDLHGALGANSAKMQQLTDIRLEYLTSTKDSCRQNTMLDWMLQLVETNMRTYYESCPGWGWDSKAKRSELQDGLARFIVAYCDNLGTNSCSMIPESKGDFSDGNTPNISYDESNKNVEPFQPDGFAHIRFEVEDDMPIIYIYEIQIAKRAQGRGLGKYIMRIIEDIAAANSISTIMLTVFSRNMQARKFYGSIGYSKHKSSPEPDTGYIILSKPIIS